MNWEINQNADLKASMAPSAFYDSPLITGDADAHKWRVTVTENGSPADLSGGSITGNFLRSDGSMVVVPGSIEGNVAGLVMPNACYAIEGPLKAAMKYVKGDQVITLAVMSLYVKLMSGETIVDPGEVIPDINVLLAKITEMETATQAANAAALNAIETLEFTINDNGELLAGETVLGRVSDNPRGNYNPDADPLYSKRDVVFHNGGSYRYINDTPSNEPTSSASHWQQIASMGGQELVDAAVAARDAAQGYKDAAANSAAQLQAGIGSPAKSYASLAALNADNPAHDRTYLTEDDWKIALWDETAQAFVAGGVYQATAISDNSIALSKIDPAIRDKITFWENQDYEEILNVPYIRIEGVATPNSFAGYHSAILPAQEGDIFKVSTNIGTSPNQTGIIFTDDDFVVLGYALTTTGTARYVEDYEAIAPAETTKIILGTYGTIDPLIVQKIRLKTLASKEYVDAAVAQHDAEIVDLDNQLQNGIKKPVVLSYTLINAKHYRDEGGVATEYDFPQYHSAFVDTAPGDVFLLSTVVRSVNQHGAIFVDDDMNIILKLLQGTGDNVTYADEMLTTPPGATRVIFSVYNTTGMVIKKITAIPIATEAYVDATLIGTVEDKITNRWHGKTAVFLGDSIVSKDYNESKPNRFPRAVCEYFGMIEKNYGITSSTIAVDESNPTSANPMVTRYTEMDDGDLIIIAGGTNDWYYTKTPLGDMSERTNYTFYGALHTLCLGLKKKYAGKTIFFMTPIMRRQGSKQTPVATNGNGKTLQEYGSIIKEVCAYYSIPVLDMYAESGLYPFDDVLAVAHYTQQGTEPDFYYTHPNDDGQLLMAKRLIGFVSQMA